jgi:hypothetical protein
MRHDIARSIPLEEPLPDAREPAALELELVAREHETKRNWLLRV